LCESDATSYHRGGRDGHQQGIPYVLHDEKSLVICASIQYRPYRKPQNDHLVQGNQDWDEVLQTDVTDPDTVAKLAAKIIRVLASLPEGGAPPAAGRPPGRIRS
jgi:hypothetical protein